MSSKNAKPVLTGQRLKFRKRDLKEKHDANGFRDEIVEGLIDADGDFEKAKDYLDKKGSQIDYRSYADSLFDVLIAGGLLAPGGGLQPLNTDEGEQINPLSVFYLANDDVVLKKHSELIVRDLLRRYKYLQVCLEDSMTKILKFVKGFEAEHTIKLAKAYAFYLSYDILTPKPLEGLLNDGGVKNGSSLNFITAMFQIWFKNDKSGNITSALRKASLANRIMEFFPSSKRTPEFFMEHCKAAGNLEEFIAFQQAQISTEVKAQLSSEISEMILAGDVPHSVMISRMEEVSPRINLSSIELASTAWECIMGVIDWSKKSDLIAEQSIRHIRTHLALLKQFTNPSTPAVDKKAQEARDKQHQLAQEGLMNTIQTYCYNQQIFLKIFSKICLLLYKAEVLEEDAVLAWYRTSSSSKGRSVFLEQMKEMVEWLENADEEEEED